MRLHLGSGSVFLEGYRNLDIRGPRTFLAADRPDLVARWKTTENKYYARHEDKTLSTLREGPLDQEYVCDEYFDFLHIPIPAWSVSEILTRQSFEHLSTEEAHKALDQMDEVLKENGVLRIDVPDHEQTLKLFRETGDEFYIRHLLGPRRGDRGFHVCSYTPERLQSLVESHGFIFQEFETNIHLYPSICAKFVKPGPRPPYEYMHQRMPKVDPAWNCVEIGPGGSPWPRANAYIDWNESNLSPLKESGKSTIVGNLESGLPQIASGAYDFCLISHVLEHVTNVQKCIDTLHRIARRGFAIMPSSIKELLFFGEESDHLWQVSELDDGSLVFVKNNKAFTDHIRDTQAQKYMCQLCRIGPNRLGDPQRYMRSFFFQNEQYMDAAASWDFTADRRLKVHVIG